jgi:carboxyl-terminal processing protease
VAIRNLTVIVLAIAIAVACHANTAKNRYANIFAEAMEVVEHEALLEIPSQELFAAGMNGMLRRLDENSSFLRGADYEEFDEELKQQYTGVGLSIQLDVETGHLVVISPMVNSPAQRAGLSVGDIILRIDGESTDGMSVDEAKARMRGPVGTPVGLTVMRTDVAEPFDVTLMRAIIPLVTVFGDRRDLSGRWAYRLEDHPEIGYIRLERFGEKTVEEMRAALVEISGSVEGLVVDLRYNGGGVLEAAVEICEMFLGPDKLVVSTRTRHGQEVQFWTRSAARFPTDIPIVVIVNRYSASASEIVAACLQDHGRAIIVGERTFGKGTVQNVIPIERGRSLLKLTVASYWRPSGLNIDRTVATSPQGDWGVHPNDGFAIEQNESQIREIQIARLRRDTHGIVSFDSDVDALPPADDASSGAAGPDTVGSEPAANGGSDAPPVPPSWPEIDVPLQRALEYLGKPDGQRAAA